jgi:hypothetical protein
MEFFEEFWGWGFSSIISCSEALGLLGSDASFSSDDYYDY